MYALQEIPGKGKGLVATRKILKNTRILSEQPLIRVLEDIHDNQTLLTSIHEQVDSLTPDVRQAFLSLHNIHSNGSTSQYLAIFQIPGLPFGDDVREGGIFLHACHINHACDNNAQRNWNEKIKRHTVHAMRDIEKGEEITIYYLGVLNGREDPQEALRRKFAVMKATEDWSVLKLERLSDRDGWGKGGFRAVVGSAAISRSKMEGSMYLFNAYSMLKSIKY
ncbi:SET domain-containing protein [Lachnellula subtilissima]|uniref:SET domain-containing protein n=1 Tax=Lachnellula subtilissima TaxID=602034 RepID=A0A8H8UAL5_9HELO|nr:SET domain-containing protein [Lachnellula subtilissima]